MKHPPTKAKDTPRSARLWAPDDLRGSFLSHYARSFPSHPFKLRLLKIFLRLLGRKEITVRHGATGTRFRADTEDFVGWEILTKGGFENASLGLCLDIMRQHGGTFADIGAHHGLFTSTVSSLTGVHVVSFEPNPASFLRLLQNVRLNGRQNVRLVHAALGRQPGLLPWRHAAEAEGTTAWSHGARENETADYWLASVGFMDALTATYSVPPTMVKMDVEGAELAVLESFDFSLCRPAYFLIEAQPHWRAKFAFLTDKGYQATGEKGMKLTGSEHDPFLEGNALFRIG